jgi:hypothetical protein
MRRIVTLLVGSAVLVLLTVAPAMAQQYPPGPTPTPLEPARGAAPAAARGGEGLAFTGSNLTLLWIGLAVLVTGVVLLMATRRRAAVRSRTRGVSEAIA